MIHVHCAIGELSVSISVEANYSPDVLNDTTLQARRELLTMYAQLADDGVTEEVS